MNKDFKKEVKNQILNQLVLENCLRFGRDPKLNNRKINHYIFGTRKKLDIFKLYELRFLLLKVYPLIHNLFLQVRLNVKKKKRFFFQKDFNLQKFAPRMPKRLREWKSFQVTRKKFNQSLTKVSKPRLPKILFATTNEMYSDIVSSAARMCSMPFHVNRWTSGAITASSSAPAEKNNWFFLQDALNAQMQKWFQKQINQNKKNTAQQEHQRRKYQLARKPSLIIIPDVSNNEIIIRETDALGIPVLGLVNSDCQNVIAYPIFANDQSVYSIHFFCHFLSSLITKEIVKTKHQWQNVSKNTIGMQFPQALKNMWKFDKHGAKIRRWVRSKFFTQNHPKNKNSRPKKKRVFKRKYFLEYYVKPRLNISTDNQKENMHSVAKKKWIFKGQYFLDHFVKPRARIRKKASRWWNVLPRVKKKKALWDKILKNKRRFTALKSIALQKTIEQLQIRKKQTQILRLSSKQLPLEALFCKYSSKRKKSKKSWRTLDFLNKNTRTTMALENQKRSRKNGMQFVLKKRMLGQMNLLLQFQKLPFSKIKREIRQPKNLPNFRFWNVASTFYYRKPIKFTINTALGYRFKRFAMKRRVRKSFHQRTRGVQTESWRNRNWKNKRKNLMRGTKWMKRQNKKKRSRSIGFRGFQHTEMYKRYAINMGLRIDYEKLFEKKVPQKRSTLYRKRWHSKKEKKK